MIRDGKFLESDFTFFDANGTKSTGTGISGVLLHGEKEKETISLSILPERESATPKIKITDPAGRIVFALPNSE